MTRAVIPSAVIDKQHQASDPNVSAWVSANAGAGKTHVLAQRVIRLLLNGTDPTKILCLTFTKAAAANMATRVFDTLATWVALDDAGLDEKIRSTGVRHVDARMRTRARRLFASALETPGGLKVQTIHGFCTRLLQQFPFEANVAAKFAVLDDTQQHQLLEQAELAVLLEAVSDANSAAGKALATATLSTGDQSFKDALREVIGLRESVEAWVGGENGLARAKADLSQMLGVRIDDTLEGVKQEFFDKAIIPLKEWPELIAVLNTGSKTDTDHIPRLNGAQTGPLDQRIKSFLSVFCTQKLERRARVVTDKIKKAHPAWAQKLDDEQHRVCALLDRQRAVVVRDRTIALLTLADTMIRHYQREKERRGLLDYDDLIARTRDLLTRYEAAWVHYKLDLGIDHLLIDEAQDTSPEQWDIVKHLVAEFTAGAGARGTTPRSIFAVGDDKQSIFSFQGAAPASFDDTRRFFEKAFNDIETFKPIKFEYSFRSVPAVLGAVDSVFGQPEAFAGLSADEVATAHSAVRDAAPGLVELWPLTEPDNAEEPDPWDAPFDTSSRTSPRVKLAQRIAANVKLWTAGNDLVGDGDKRHAARPGDVLILVRQRGPLFEAVIRALKNAGVPVAGADRLVLTEHIAVMDLLVLADALLLPQDDLALATVLKSPLFGISEEELFDLAWDRGKRSLRDAVREKRPDIADRLDALAQRARQLTPFAFYAELLGAGGGRKAFLSRLGHEANDALDEFLNLALDYESREIPSLQGFVSWLRTASASIKRDMEIARDEVRVMTVHGAKGLEAPIVVLADTTTQPEGPAHFQPKILSLSAENAVPGTPDRLVWMPNKDDDTKPIANARAVSKRAAQDEYRRLLYVAMTRAADRLIVCGAAGSRAIPPGCWYQLVDQGLSDVIEVAADDGVGTVRRFQKFTDASPAAKSATSEPARAPETPAWLSAKLPGQTKPLAITPSSLDEMPARPQTATSREARKAAMARGTLTHRLLQSLPDVALERRKMAAENYLARAAKDFSDTQRAEILRQAFAIIDDKKFAALFSPGSKSEVPVVGRIDLPGKSGVAVNGQIDRLAVTGSEVLIADYKTNRPAPKSLEAVPKAYLRQMALYRAMLTRIYPGKPIRAALIWTDASDLMELSDKVLDAALA